ncbi:flagellar hook-length control protein FliK [Acetivibrio straminisolvens]|uniref:Flagellar hook-length control protein FliK n=2 Tax=Acetivibrio straminisolvens TaxID=253314 RepID=W4V8A1_9FIRM|nr:flagellar hook-length control protein FliK [Acetivibrio straminisolvens]GAE88969.1 flagellar hook-length control protein FliK [Acetivibrio straminisolvens JCM 21531]
MVIAKFVAENEQVKAALESNMNMLKESLEKQGFSVEGFSVTVGDNKRREDGRDEMNKGTANQRISNEKLQVSDVAGVERMQKIHQSINPYGYEGSSINLTA